MKREKQSTSDLKREIIRSLIEEFKDDPEYREGYTEEFFNSKISTQIKVLREQREWSQSRLAELSEMAQTRVSVLEDVSYDAWTLNVLRRLANAFGLVVDVEFKEYGEFLKEFEIFGKERLQKRSFKDDPVFSGSELDAKVTSSGNHTDSELVLIIDNPITALPAQQSLPLHKGELHLVASSEDSHQEETEEAESIDVPLRFAANR